MLLYQILSWTTGKNGDIKLRQSNRELWFAFIAIVFVTLAYFFMVIQSASIPGASTFFGHTIGILGFVLMLMTETLYTLRKRSKSARWGRMAAWLQFHIFTGLVGPYMVLLHSSWKFNGLAGIVTLLTAVIVISGIVGRYIYTAIPRTSDGIALEVDDLSGLISETETSLSRWMEKQPPSVQKLIAAYWDPREKSDKPFQMIFGRFFSDFVFKIKWWRVKQKMDVQFSDQASDVGDLIKRKRALHRQIATLANARKLLALWHTVHIPIGMALFTTAFVHIVAALYFTSSLR
jgi:hypothetical protein